MIDWLLHIDQQALLAINGCHAPWADNLMWLVSQRLTWLPLYLLLLGLVIWRYKANIRLIVSILLAFVLAVGLADCLASWVIKPFVCRLRPTHEPALQGMLHLVCGYTGGLYGFVSNHAANTMASALLFTLLWRNSCATVGLMLWVALNCYSRMYLGVHYPLDIVGGLIIGSLTACLAYWLLRRMAPFQPAKEPVLSRGANRDSADAP